MTIHGTAKAASSKIAGPAPNIKQQGQEPSLEWVKNTKSTDYDKGYISHTANLITGKSPHTEREKLRKFHEHISITLHRSFMLNLFIHIFVFCIVLYGTGGEFRFQDALLLCWL